MTHMIDRYGADWYVDDDNECYLGSPNGVVHVQRDVMEPKLGPLHLEQD